MSDLGLIETEIRGLPAELRPTFLRIFRDLVKNLRFGHPSGDAPDPLTNFAGAFLTGTTHATPGSEITIEHGFGRTPYLAIPVLPLDAVGAQIVPLTVTRAADSRRIYLSSSVADANFTIAVEG